MPKTSPAPAHAENADVADLDSLKSRVRDIINDAESLLPALATLQRDGKIMADHRNHHLISRVECILVDSVVQLTHTIG